MPTIYRPKSPRLLTSEQKAAKLAKDKEYELACEAENAVFYPKKRTSGVTSLEQTTHDEKARLRWEAYKDWSIANGLYESVPLEQQKAEIEADITEVLARLNVVRAELGLAEIKIRL